MKESILIAIICIFIYIYIYIHKNNYITVESNTGSAIKIYNDELNHEKTQLLSLVVDKMILLRNYLNENKDSNELKDYKIYINQLVNNFTSDTDIHETDPNSDLTSYSVNKGEELSVCLKSKKTRKLHDINLLMYVVIHEMSHFACPEIGHGELFQKIFRKFTNIAIKINLYNYDDYNQKPVEYCGMTLSSNVV